jgi:hypothetical protein
MREVDTFTEEEWEAYGEPRVPMRGENWIVHQGPLGQVVWEDDGGPMPINGRYIVRRKVHYWLEDELIPAPEGTGRNSVGYFHV